MSSALFDDPTALRRLAAEIAGARLGKLPRRASRYVNGGNRDAADDTAAHLLYLGQAVDLGESSLFEDYVAWAKVTLASRGIDPAALMTDLEEIRSAVSGLGGGVGADAVKVVDAVLDRFPSMPGSCPTGIHDAGELEEAARQYLASILEGRRQEADALVRRLVEEGAGIADVYLRVFEPVQHEIGRLWQMNRVTVAQEHFCTAAVQRSMAQLYPMLFTGAPGRPRVVAACVGGELHEVGLRMVTDLLELSGFDTVYLGAGVPAGSVVEMAAARPTALVAISATITPNLRALRSLVSALRATRATAGVPVMVGGYPFRLSETVAARIGADATAFNAAEAVRVAEELVRRA